MTDNELKSKISEWLKTSGGMLELKAARAFQMVGFSVSQGYHFVDVQTGKVREADLLAFDQRHCRTEDGDNLTIAVTFMIECKRSNRKPWLGLISNDESISSVTEALPHQMMLSPLASEHLAMLMSGNFEENQTLFEVGKSACAISTVHFGEGEDKSAATNGAYAATQQVLDASFH